MFIFNSLILLALVATTSAAPTKLPEKIPSKVETNLEDSFAKIDEYLEKNVKEEDPSASFEAAKKWLETDLKSSGEKDLIEAVNLFTSLEDITGEDGCSERSAEILKKNDAASSGLLVKPSRGGKMGKIKEVIHKVAAQCSGTNQVQPPQQNQYYQLQASSYPAFNYPVNFYPNYPPFPNPGYPSPYPLNHPGFFHPPQQTPQDYFNYQQHLERKEEDKENKQEIMGNVGGLVAAPVLDYAGGVVGDIVPQPVQDFADNFGGYITDPVGTVEQDIVDEIVEDE